MNTALRPRAQPTALAAADAGPRLLADIGGTNARFAWQAGPGAAPEAVQVLACAEHATLLDAARRYLAETGLATPRLGAIGIANPVTGDAVQMTNHHWSFSIEALRTALGLQRLVVMNDFEALARSLPLLGADEKVQIAGGRAADGQGAPIALIGPGTGLGVGGLVPTRGGWVPLAGEGGHVTLAPVTPREAAVVAALQQRFGHASAERAVSGPGLVWLVEALCAVDGVPAPPDLDAARVTQRGQDGSCARCTEALQLFFAFLGSTAGNLALTLGARGGVYLGGGIVPRLQGLLKASDFHARFVGKGRFRGYLAAMPVVLITSTQHPALRGAAAAL
ncbi:glucokinase [Rubrivivax sp. RP6-9]|uniref:glucokinase n=1 Tax=Rubrivivax sp. RP6-9 TaxID=3415750 RepID=UPI003CC634B1